MSLQISGTPIPTPQGFYVDDIDLRKDARVTSGKMVVDYIATKKKFTLQYSHLTGTQLNALLGLLTAAVFVVLTYPTETGSTTATVTAGNIPRRLWSNEGSKQYDNIRIELIEQ